MECQDFTSSHYLGNEVPAALSSVQVDDLQTSVLFCHCQNGKIQTLANPAGPLLFFVLFLLFWCSALVRTLFASRLQQGGFALMRCDYSLAVVLPFNMKKNNKAVYPNLNSPSDYSKPGRGGILINLGSMASTS